uniref:Uncharacterized protein n=1 Tax=Lygus hesperus TaxID=30085 RepID=A0A0A9X9T8_LYGHE
MKTANKLQLLLSNSELNTKPEIKEKIAELLESENILKDTKQTLSRKETLDLNSEDVQCYMQTRMKNRFERSPQLNISTENKDMDKDTKISDMFEEMSRTQKEGHNSSATEIQTTQTIQSVKDLGLNHVPSTDQKISENSQSNCSENNNNGNVESCIIEAAKKSSVDMAVGEVSTKSVEEKQNHVGIPLSTGTSSLKSDKAEPDEQGTGINCTRTLNQNKGMIDDNSDTKSQCSMVLQSKTNPLLQLIVGTPKSANKLQLLAKTRELKLNNQNRTCSINGKLQNMWEQTLNVKTNPSVWNGKKYSSKGHKDIFEGILGKTSAAVKIAQGYNLNKPPSYNVKLAHPAINNTNILDGFTFPCRKARRKPTHNVLKKLTSSASLRKSRQKTQSITKKPVRRGRSLDPANEIHLYKRDSVGKDRGFPSFSENLTDEGAFKWRSAEYSRGEDRLAKMASEFMMKRKLTRPRTVGDKWKLSGPKEKFPIQKQQRPTSYSSVQDLRELRADYGIRKEKKLEPRIRKSVNDVQSKLMSMPQVRHQIEHYELPLGPLEVQPGLAPLIYGKSSSTFRSADNSWESVLYNEYVRSNLLPSLKDTRETFHLEERPL